MYEVNGIAMNYGITNWLEVGILSIVIYFALIKYN